VSIFKTVHESPLHLLTTIYRYLTCI
jgi:hypothetical protein